MDWQPISTAVRDGSYIIAAKFGPSPDWWWVTHSRWISAHEIADMYGYDPSECQDGWTDGYEDDELCYPTHWMPLPPPPEGE